jgi:hypothetical protein
MDAVELMEMARVEVVIAFSPLPVPSSSSEEH